MATAKKKTTKTKGLDVRGTVAKAVKAVKAIGKKKPAAAKSAPAPAPAATKPAAAPKAAAPAKPAPQPALAVGTKVHYRPRSDVSVQSTAAGDIVQLDRHLPAKERQPIYGTVVFAPTPGTVNLRVVDHSGKSHYLPNVPVADAGTGDHFATAA